MKIVKSIDKISDVVVVNDGSTDNTESEALSAGARVINHTTNLGKGSALQTGFKHTLDGLDVIALPGGTNVLHRGKMMIVTHDNQTLSYDNRREFAATYSGTPLPPQQIIKKGNSR